MREKTASKFKMEPENDGFQKESYFPGADCQGPMSNFRVTLKIDHHAPFARRTQNPKNITRNKDKIPAKDTRDTPKRFVPIAMVYFLIFLKKISFHQKKHIRSFPGQTSSELWFSLGFSILYGLDSGSPTPLLSWGVPRWRCGTQGCESVCMVFLPHTHIYIYIIFYIIYMYIHKAWKLYIFMYLFVVLVSLAPFLD